MPIKEQTFVDPLTFRELKSGDNIKLIGNGIIFESFIESISEDGIVVAVSRNKKRAENMSILGAVNTIRSSTNLKGLKIKCGDLIEVRTKHNRRIQLKVDMIINDNALILEIPNSKTKWSFLDKLKLIFK